MSQTMDIKRNTFAKLEDAEALCWLLAKETGQDYTVEADVLLGFTARRRNVSSATRHMNHDRPQFSPTWHRQSFRGFITHYAQIAVGLFLVTKTGTVLNHLFTFLEINSLPSWLDIMTLVKSIAFLGALLCFYGLRFLYSYYARKLCINDGGILLVKGIIAQDQVLIRFTDIKSLAVRRTITDRLLGVGSLHLDSAATNGDVDIIFDNLVNPIGMRNHIQALIDSHSNHLTGGFQ